MQYPFQVSFLFILSQANPFSFVSKDWPIFYVTDTNFFDNNISYGWTIYILLELCLDDVLPRRQKPLGTTSIIIKTTTYICFIQTVIKFSLTITLNKFNSKLLECRPREILYDTLRQNKIITVLMNHTRALGGIIIIKFTLSNPATAENEFHMGSFDVPSKTGISKFSKTCMYSLTYSGTCVLHQYYYEFGWQLPENTRHISLKIPRIARLC